jgi:hypothetical protein
MNCRDPTGGRGAAPADLAGRPRLSPGQASGMPIRAQAPGWASPPPYLARAGRHRPSRMPPEEAVGSPTSYDAKYYHRTLSRSTRRSAGQAYRKAPRSGRPARLDRIHGRKLSSVFLILRVWVWLAGCGSAAGLPAHARDLWSGRVGWWSGSGVGGRVDDDVRLDARDHAADRRRVGDVEVTAAQRMHLLSGQGGAEVGASVTSSTAAGAVSTPVTDGPLFHQCRLNGLACPRSCTAYTSGSPSTCCSSRQASHAARSSVRLPKGLVGSDLIEDVTELISGSRCRCTSQAACPPWPAPRAAGSWRSMPMAEGCSG